MATTTTPSKTQGTSLLTVQNLANNTVLASSAQDVSGKFKATISVRVGRDVTTALTNPANVRIQMSMKSSGNDTWVTIKNFQTQIIAAIQNTLTGSSNASGQPTLTATANFTQSDGDLCFIKNGTIGNSEFVRLKHVTAAVTVDCFDNLTNTQINSTVTNKAEEFTLELYLEAVGRIRVVVDTLNTGQAVNVDANMVTCDNFSNA